MSHFFPVSEAVLPDNTFIDILCSMVFFHLRILNFLMGISLIVLFII